MKKHPAVSTAQVYLRYGRLREAIETLETALSIEPENKDIEHQLQELRCRHRESTIGGVRHQAVGWLCLIGAFAILSGPPLVLLKLLEPDLPGLPKDGAAALVGAVALLAICVIVLVLAVHIFLWLWFSYLSRLPRQEREFAEECLDAVLSLSAFEPQYSRARHRRLGEGHAEKALW